MREINGESVVKQVMRCKKTADDGGYIINCGHRNVGAEKIHNAGNGYMRVFGFLTPESHLPAIFVKTALFIVISKKNKV